MNLFASHLANQEYQCCFISWFAIEDGIRSTTELIDLSQEVVIIYDGPFDPRIYQNEQVVRAIRAAVARSVEIEVVCDDGAQIVHPDLASMVDQGSIKVYKKKLPTGYFNLIFGRRHKDNGHYMVVAGRFTREELGPHKVESDMRRALVDYLGEKAEKLTRNFYRMRDS